MLLRALDRATAEAWMEGVRTTKLKVWTKGRLAGGELVVYLELRVLSLLEAAPGPMAVVD